ncbi:DUF3941 domain-containing protein [Bacillus lacus]|uniref:DUF3941 domain-containing protein n=1 Tax=Metabacillus lacus TaxID=1983721 RepID=A0A7X2J118_9BACI|nr:DUF3941 domain-containing protein [Metabacillus lacus]MRX73487.1 DUF3941 domain-containing protein [Metabacillus lacus]
MSNTRDDDKKPKDNNAKNHLKNLQEAENSRQGKKSYSKKTDHL